LAQVHNDLFWDVKFFLGYLERTVI
jgi:hypothetical protein